MFSLVSPERLNVLTIHAEAEGLACLDLFRDFVRSSRKKGVDFVPLGNLLRDKDATGSGILVKREIPGREGWVSCQVPGTVSGRRMD